MDRLSQFLQKIKTQPGKEGQAPVAFVGHGNPMNAIEDNRFSQTWKSIGQQLPRPRAIIVISAHWLSRGTLITAMENPQTIHDFYGFPQKMYEQQYPAPGYPDLAESISKTEGVRISKNYDWGLDHGTWSVLKPMFPDADIPVLQISLDHSLPPADHFEIARHLKNLRSSGVLIIGSGNIVHNLSRIKFSDEAYDWAIEFDDTVKNLIDQRNFKGLIQYEKLGSSANLSVPTNDHYLPLLYATALVEGTDEIRYFNEVNTMGSISMRSFLAG